MLRGASCIAALLKHAALVAPIAIAWAWSCGTALALPSYTQVKEEYRASDILVLDHGGQLLQRVRIDYQGRRGDWVALKDISPALQNAVILSEDRRFYSHAGVDWQAMASAAWDNLAGHRQRGASTLSMQLAALVDARFHRTAGGRSLSDKIDQAFAARSLERGWTKPEILEAYLNLVSFRGEVAGVDALARVLFQKHVSGLDAREAALAAALLRGPNASRATLTRRACGLLKTMGRRHECEGLDDFIYRSLLRKSAPRADRADLAPHLAQWVLTHVDTKPGIAISTSVDAPLQRFVLGSMDRHIRALQSSNVRDAAVVVLDNASGQVLAYVGSSGSLSAASRVDHARALRQAGSTLKPFLYAQAIEQERLTPVSLLSDGPLNLPTGNGLYIPQNYDRNYSGWVSVRTALASSLNIPAVRTLVMVTVDAFARRLVQLGLPLDRTGDYYGYSLALGSADVTLLSLTNAYRALANQGRYSPVRFLAATKTTAPKQIMSPEASWIVGDILADRHARARTFGFDSPLTTSFWTAVKTGTSKDMRDNWCIGWSQRYTVGVWVGNSGGASMRDVSGVSGAGPLWHEIMNYLHRGRDSRQAPQPATVTRRMVVFESNVEPAREDVFVGDTAVSQVWLSDRVASVGPASAAIVQPARGTILALDPDIPATHQRSWLRATNLVSQKTQQVIWRINNNIVGQGGEVAWLPQPGKHRVELLDGDGRVLDSVILEVRGAAAVN